jgi:hypothetical protein
MDVVRTAIYQRLAASSDLSDLLTGIHHLKAPPSSKYPYAIFHRQAGTLAWTMGKHPAFKDELWLVKGVARGLKADAADDIDARCEALLNDAPLALEGKTLLFCLRESDVPAYSEADGGEAIFHVGGLYRLKVEP